MSRSARVLWRLCLVLSSLALVGCSDDPEQQAPEEDALIDVDASPEPDADTADSASVEVEDAPDTAGDQDADADDAGDAQLEEVEEDTAPPPFECVPSCEVYQDIIGACLGEVLDALDLGGFAQAPRSVAVAFSRVDAATLQRVREVVGEGAAVHASAREGVVIVDGVDPAWAAPRLAALPGARRARRALLTPDGQRVVPAPRLMVRFAPDTRDVEARLAAAGAALLEPLHFMPGAYAARLLDPDGDALAAARALEADPAVTWVEPDLLRTYARREDPLITEQWHLRAEGHPVAAPSADIMADEAWTLTRGSEAITIAVFDDGVDTAHPDLAARVVPGLHEPADLDDALGSGCCSHGTAVAGVAAAIGDNDLGGSGVCPTCRVMPNFVEFGALSDLQIAQDFVALADLGADVINCSWGIPGGNPYLADDDRDPYTLPSVVTNAFAYVEEHGRGGLGAVIVYAAGNSNEDARDPYTLHPTTLSVAAYTDQTVKSWYSEYGETVDLSAPSSGGFTAGITTTIPSRGADYGGALLGAQGERYTQGFGGTSSAAPVVSGVAGLMLSVNPALRAAEVRDLLRQTARPIDPARGAYDPQGHSPFYGHGAVNAYAAVLAALGPQACADAGLDEACNGVDDDCNGVIDDACPVADDCAPCTFAEACAGGVCASLPGDVGEFCLSPCVEGACAEGFSCQNTLCVPDAGRCSPCAEAEACNGVDDDCNGLVDDAIACEISEGRCRQDTSCGPGGVCFGGACQSLCEVAQGCAAGECVGATLRYGEVDALDVCTLPQGPQLCRQYICGSSAEEREKRRFISCVERAGDTCGLVALCAAPFLP